MEKYSLSRSEEQPSLCPFSCLSKDTPQIRVKDGSKIRNLLRFAFSRMGSKPDPGLDSGPDPGPDQKGASPEAHSRTVVFTASGKVVSKAITCAEILKRRVKGLHQVTQLDYSLVLDLWEPLEPGLDPLTVNRKLPCIWILLSSQPLDRCMLGYQAPGRHDQLWANQDEVGGATPHRTGTRKRRGGGARPHRDSKPPPR